jgi:hypothetical protein
MYSEFAPQSSKRLTAKVNRYPQGEARNISLRPRRGMAPDGAGV